ncbi:MAG: Peptidoglycan-N-acetylmuramic acid deacetylase PdaA precursor [Firmicutes bacterium ADurb.Bin300]|nr:MAG: Peptidoglycan-N-acetylmuramic acid deacetylase PdaA precursor [Firmicutes bacterium ADurb.Bin300]
MKKTVAVILCLSAVFFSACNKNVIENTNTDTTSTVSESANVTDTSLPQSTFQPETQTETPSSTNSPTQESTMPPTVKPITVGTIPLNKNSSYGENTGTSATYTGLEPLPLKKFTVLDPENTKGLGTAAKLHSYGVAKDGKPNKISVENQKYYSQYGALTLDTSGEKVIYLTFDCGYENNQTEKILDTLLNKQIPATFFVTLPYLKSSPKIAARMIKEGHTVGNHSSTHPDFSTINRTLMSKEIQEVDNYLRLHFGYSSPYFRFPRGVCSDNSLELVFSLGYTSVFWSTAYADWDTANQRGADYAFSTVTSRLHPGCILLLHAVSSDNASALGKIIDFALREGYSFVTLD